MLLFHKLFSALPTVLYHVSVNSFGAIFSAHLLPVNRMPTTTARGNAGSTGYAAPRRQSHDLSQLFKDRSTS